MELLKKQEIYNHQLFCASFKLNILEIVLWGKKNIKGTFSTERNMNEISVQCLLKDRYLAM